MLRDLSQKPLKIRVASESHREILEYNLLSGVARSLGLRFAVSVKTPSLYTFIQNFGHFIEGLGYPKGKTSIVIYNRICDFIVSGGSQKL